MLQLLDATKESLILLVGKFFLIGWIKDAAGTARKAGSRFESTMSISYLLDY